ncbi:MAG: hypothetical protein Q9179_000573 [Wetmoreana sp. 5 TL-2023]
MLTQAGKVAKVSAKAAPSVTVKSSVTTSKASPNPPSVVSRAVEASSVFLLVCFPIPLILLILFLSPLRPSSPLQPLLSLTQSHWITMLTYLNSDLRRNPRRPQNLPRIRHSRCCHLYRAREAEDGYEFGCCLCVEETGTHALWIRWIGMEECVG